MPTATIKYLGNLKTEATHSLSGKKILTEAPLDNQGTGKEFSPTDLCATSLGCCMMTILAILARDNHIDIEGVEAEVLKVMAQSPRRIQRIEVIMRMPPKSYSSEEKSVMMDAAYNCPVKKSLNLGIDIDIIFIW